jgi:fructoselysine 3-epimerase
MSQVAVMGLTYLFYSFKYFLDSMVELDVHNVELWGGYPHLYAEDVTVADVKQIAQEMRRRDLSIICYTPEQVVYPLNIAAPDARARARSLEFFLRNAEIAAELEAKRMFVTSGWGYRDEPVAEAWKRSCDSLQKIAEKAASLGLSLVLEALRPEESNLVTDLPTLDQMTIDIGSPLVGCCLDTVAMAVAGESIDGYYERLGGRVDLVHFNDGNPSGHLVWGEGCLPLQEYVGQLESHRYRGYLTLELHPETYCLDPHGATKRSLRALAEVLE